MTSRGRARWALGAALCALGLAVWLLWGRGDGAESGTGPERESGPESGLGGDGPMLVGSRVVDGTGPASESEPGSGGEDTGGAVAPAEDVGDAEFVLALDLRMDGVEVGEAFEGLISVHIEPLLPPETSVEWIQGPPPVAPIDRTGAHVYALDVHASYAEPYVGHRRMRIGFDHPRYVPVVREIAFPEEGGRVSLEVHLAQATLLRGRIDDVPADAVVTVYLWPLADADTPPGAVAPLDFVSVGAAGDFQFRVKPEQALLLGVRERRDRPADSVHPEGFSTRLGGREVHAGPAGVQEVRAPRLVQTHAVGGRVMMGGLPIADAQMFIEAETSVREYAANNARHSDDVLAWQDGLLFRTRGWLQSGADGSFSTAGALEGGFANRLHSLHVYSGDDILVGVDLSDSDLGRVGVTPPRDDVVVELPAATIRVRVLMEGQPAADHPVLCMVVGELEGGREAVFDSLEVLTDATGEARVRATPGGIVRLVASGEGYEMATTTVEGMAEGTDRLVVMDLQPEGARGTLLIELEGEGTDELTDLWVGFAHGGGEDGMAASPRDVKQLERTDRGFVYEDALPGEHILVVRTGADFLDVGALWQEARVPVEVLPRGDQAVRVAMLRGSSFELRLRDSEGKPIGAAVTLADSSGETKERLWVLRDDGNRLIALDEVFPGQHVFLVGALAPGTYSLTITPHGREPITREFEAVAGEPAVVEVRVSE